MKSALALAALAIVLATAAPASDLIGPRPDPRALPQGPGHAGQLYVSPDGCTYSRAQAPGYAPTWHLVRNGAVLGLTNAHKGCATMLGDPL